MTAGIIVIVGIVLAVNVGLLAVAYRLSRPRPLPPISVVIESSSVKRRTDRRSRAVPHRDREEAGR